MRAIAKLILGIICTLGVTCGEDHLNVLCGVLSKKATRQRLKHCNDPQRSLTALREKRNVQTTVRGTVAPTNASLVSTTYKRTLNSYVCDFYNDFPFDRNGYETNGEGMILNVNIYKEGGKWRANVSWSRPLQGTQIKCTGYSINWYKPGGIFDTEYCDKIMNENVTSYVIDSSKGWKDLPYLAVAVFPLPARRKKRIVNFRKFKIPIVTTSSQSTTSQPSQKITAIQASSEIGPQTNITTISPTENLVIESPKTLSNIAVATIVAGIGLVAVTIGIALVIYWKYRKKGIIVTKGDGPYVSYYSDNSRITHSVIEIGAWFAQHNINVIMDKFAFITYSKRRWSEHHVFLAKRVILMISPGYLKICKFDTSRKNIKNMEKEMSGKDQLAYYEICHIRDEVVSKPELADKRFVVVLVETDLNQLPFWMKRLHAYKYSGGKLDESILELLKV